MWGHSRWLTWPSTCSRNSKIAKCTLPCCIHLPDLCGPLFSHSPYTKNTRLPRIPWHSGLVQHRPPNTPAFWRNPSSSNFLYKLEKSTALIDADSFSQSYDMRAKLCPKLFQNQCCLMKLVDGAIVRIRHYQFVKIRHCARVPMRHCAGVEIMHYAVGRIRHCVFVRV